MSSDHSSEFARIAKLAQAFAGTAGLGVERAIGDDAAILVPPGEGRIVWTIDAQVQGVHFRDDLVSWGDVGWRSFMAAASDLAAMGAEPWCALSSLVLPRSLDDAALDAIVEGQAAAAKALGSPIVGGNMSRGDAVSITTTLLGTCARAIERRAAKGDLMWLSGSVGLAAAGLAALERNMGDDDALQAAIMAWRRPSARIDAGRAMADVARGAIDVSDGLAQDVAHIARASTLCAVIDEAALLVHGGALLATTAARLRVEPTDLALYGGEDYALVVASVVPIAGFSCIGRFDEGNGVALVPVSPDKNARGVIPITPRGFDHFK